jgi:hypothetical protein
MPDSIPTPQPPQPDEWLIFSAKWTPRGADICMFWAPNSCGYVTDLDKAGVYTWAEANLKVGDSDSYAFDTGWPVRKADAEEHVRRTSLVGDWLRVARAAAVSRASS